MFLLKAGAAACSQEKMTSLSRVSTWVPGRLCGWSSVVLGHPVPSTRPHIETVSVDPGRVRCHLSLEQAQCLIKHEVVLSGAWTEPPGPWGQCLTLCKAKAVFLSKARGCSDLRRARARQETKLIPCGRASWAPVLHKGHCAMLSTCLRLHATSWVSAGLQIGGRLWILCPKRLLAPSTHGPPHPSDAPCQQSARLRPGLCSLPRAVI